jgi:hypothetical protein
VVAVMPLDSIEAVVMRLDSTDVARRQLQA